MRRYFSIVPLPDEKHPAPLRPSVKKEGPYTLFRDVQATEVLLTEPDGMSYYFEWFEVDKFLHLTLRILNEMCRNVILDRLWDFHKIQFDPKIPDIVRVVR
ncbi:MAG: hypothetical protein L0Y56_14765 [Nitrospira sp.]|nr:hypothetical protein [Nitrospira sp.]